MIPNADQLRVVSQMREGDLGEIPFAVLLFAMAVHRRSVVLEIERKPLRKEIILESGVPVDCRSNSLHETLPRFMVSEGLLTEEKSQEFLNKAATQGLQFGEAMIVEGAIGASDLYRVLQQCLARKLLDGFTWRSGKFRISTSLPKVESPLKVNAPQLVVTGISKFALDDEVNDAVGPLVGKKLFVHPNPPYALSEIHLSKIQRRLTELLEGGKRIDELAAETTIPFDQIMRLLYSLAIIGTVVPEDWLPKEVEPAPSAPPPTAGAKAPGQPTPEAAPRRPKRRVPVAPPPRPSAGPSSSPGAGVSMPAPTTGSVAGQEVEVLAPEAIEKLRNQVMEAYLRHRKQDAFDLLGVPEESTQVDVQDRFLDYSRRFAPWNFEKPGLESLVEKAEDLFLAGGMAFGELCDPDRRRALLKRRQIKEQEAKKSRGGASDRFAIKSNLLDPELQFKKGKALLRADKYREASQLLQFAYDCDSQNSTYRAELAYCKFMIEPEHAASSSLEELGETLRIDPKAGLALYYSGMINMEIGSFDRAEQQLRDSIKLLMPDRRPIEALKTLQTKSKQKKRRLLGG